MKRISETMESASTEEDRSAVRRKVGGNKPISVYFRGIYTRDRTSPAYWFTFPLADGDAPRDAPRVLKAFSKTYQSVLSTVVGHKSVLYCLGGKFNSRQGPLNDFYFFDTAHPSKGWLSGPKMIVPRVQPKAVVVDGKIYVMGGIFKNRNKMRSIEQWAEFFDPSTNCWKLLPVSLPLTLSPFPDDPDVKFPFCIMALGSGGCDREILLFSANGAYVFDVIDHSLNRLGDPLGFSRNRGIEIVDRCPPLLIGKTICTFDWCFGGSFIAYDLDQNAWASKELELVGRNEDSQRNMKDSLINLNGLSAAAAATVANQLFLLWAGQSFDSELEFLHCSRFEVSPKTTCWFDELDADMKSSKCYLIPRGGFISSALVLEGKLGDAETIEGNGCGQVERTDTGIEVNFI